MARASDPSLRGPGPAERRSVGQDDRSVRRAAEATTAGTPHAIDGMLLEDRQVVIVRLGKGKKDRGVPIGQRALKWVKKYVADVRPQLVTDSHSILFVNANGNQFVRGHLSVIVKNCMKRAGIKKSGSCHLLRHTAATLMMENGADLRSLQQFLGHARLTTTQIYTHVSASRLKEVHARTHPASLGGA